jgi:dienelactone hydrolase
MAQSPRIARPRRGRPTGLRRIPRFGVDDRELRTEPLELDTEDGKRWDAMLFEPKGVRRDAPAAVMVHGSVGNYLGGFPRRVSFGLAERGHVVLSINTRMANYGAIFGGGVFHQTPMDIAAGVEALRRRGYQRIVLCGYSMGATMVSYYQATIGAPEVEALCTFAHPHSLPASLRRRWDRFGARPSYDVVTERVQAALGEEPERSPGDRIIVVRRSGGPTDNPEDTEVWAYSSWWFSRGPKADAARSWRWMDRVGVPVCFIQAGDDPLVGAGEAPRLAALVRQSGVTLTVIHTIEGADHVFNRRESEAAAAASDFLELIDRGEPGAPGS